VRKQEVYSPRSPYLWGVNGGRGMDSAHHQALEDIENGLQAEGHDIELAVAFSDDEAVDSAVDEW